MVMLGFCGQQHNVSVTWSKLMLGLCKFCLSSWIHKIDICPFISKKQGHELYVSLCLAACAGMTLFQIIDRSSLVVCWNSQHFITIL